MYDDQFCTKNIGMRSYIRLICYLYLALISTSCVEQRKVRKIMSEFVETEIVIPDDLECIYKRNISGIRKDTLKPNKLIVFYDTSDCSSCRISHLIDLYPIYDMADTSGFSVLTIFSPKPEDVKDVILQLTIADHLMPIYVDATGEFNRLNQNIPSDLRFHSFLLDENNKPIFVGNPLSSYKLLELFTETIKVHHINN